MRFRAYYKHFNSFFNQVKEKNKLGTGPIESSWSRSYQSPYDYLFSFVLFFGGASQVGGEDGLGPRDVGRDVVIVQDAGVKVEVDVRVQRQDRHSLDDPLLIAKLLESQLRGIACREWGRHRVDEVILEKFSLPSLLPDVFVDDQFSFPTRS